MIRAAFPDGAEHSAPISVGAMLALERVTGIEPALSAWEADVLPLNYTRVRPHGERTAMSVPGVR